MSSAPDDPHALVTPPDVAAVSAFLRALAARVERDQAFGRQIAELLARSGLLAAEGVSSVGHASHSSVAQRGRGTKASVAATTTSAATNVDIFAVLRDSGIPGLEAHLNTLDVGDLRQIIRRHRLDPARISARWNNRARLIALITDQVRARAEHGKAFAKV